MKIGYTAFFSFLLLMQASLLSAQPDERFRFQSNHMGSLFTIVLYGEDESAAQAAADSAFALIEELNQIMSDYLPESELNRFSGSSSSGEWFALSDPLFHLLQHAVEISEATGGLFDVTAGPMTRAWRMARMMPVPELPDEKELSELFRRVGFHHLQLDEETQSGRLLAEGIQLDLGGIAKGYAAEKAMQRMSELGFPVGFVDAGGDISLGDPSPGREGWDVAVPVNRNDPAQGHLLIRTSNRTVTTSGDMFQFILVDGVRYSHIIHPETGIGSTSQQQATVISTSGIWADAYASALTLMEPDDALALIESLPDTEAVVFRMVGDERVQWRSSGAHLFIQNREEP